MIGVRSSVGPILFRQKGSIKKPFYRKRSMYIDSEKTSSIMGEHMNVPLGALSDVLIWMNFLNFTY